MVGSLQTKLCSSLQFIVKTKNNNCMHANKLTEITCTKHAKGVKNLYISPTYSILRIFLFTAYPTNRGCTCLKYSMLIPVCQDYTTLGIQSQAFSLCLELSIGQPAKSFFGVSPFCCCVNSGLKKG